jgi:hypothetical protein
MIDQKKKLMAVKHEYFSNPRISNFIDCLTEQTYEGIDHSLLAGYESDFIKLIIKEFWIAGRAIFNYPCEQVVMLYDPSLSMISPIPDSYRCKIIYCEKDISDKVLFVARREHPFDWLGTSIIGENNRISSFKLDDFNDALSNAVGLFNKP